MWIFALLLAGFGLLLFSRLRRYNVSMPIALAASVAVEVLPIILIPIIGIWLLVRLVSGKSLISFRSVGIGHHGAPGTSRSESGDSRNHFCSKCGEDGPFVSGVCPACGNAISV